MHVRRQRLKVEHLLGRQQLLKQCQVVRVAVFFAVPLVQDFSVFVVCGEIGRDRV